MKSRRTHTSINSDILTGSLTSIHHLVITAFHLQRNRILDVLQITKDEIDVLILNFNRPSKTFFEANIDQSVLIGRLWSLLPSAKPFLCPPSIPGTGHDMRGADGEYWACATRVVRIKSEEDGGTAAERFPRDGRGGGAVKRERENEAVAMGCFDRGPRSRSVLPSTRGPPKREFRWAAPLSLS